MTTSSNVTLRDIAREIENDKNVVFTSDAFKFVRRELRAKFGKLRETTNETNWTFVRNDARFNVARNVLLNASTRAKLTIDPTRDHDDTNARARAKRDAHVAMSRANDVLSEIENMRTYERAMDAQCASFDAMIASTNARKSTKRT